MRLKRDAPPEAGVPSDHFVLLEVADTGVGMDEETQANIFTPFYTTKSRGIGLGLAVTTRVIEAHGGTISVQSTPQVGTSFKVTVRVGAPIVSVSQ